MGIKQHTVQQDHTLVIGIITCSKNIDKIATIRATWGKDLIKNAIPYYFIIGDPTIDNYKIVKDILYVPCADTYESLLQKVCYLYKYVIEHTPYDYVYKVDDDCYVNVELLYNTCFWNFNYLGRLVGTEETQLNREWHVGKCSVYIYNTKPYTGKYYGAWCGGGYGYFLSRKAMEVIVLSTFIDEDLYEDKAIGDALRMKNILPQRDEKYIAQDLLELNSDNTKRVVFSDCITQYSNLIFKAVVITEVKKNHQFLDIRDKKELLKKLNG